MQFDYTMASLDRVMRAESGATEIAGPAKVTVFPTNKCNLDCEHCWRVWADYDRTHKTEMSDERLLELVDEGHELGVLDWYFVGGGEPMVRGKVVMDMIAKMTEYEMSAIIHTNGTLFRDWMYDKLFEYNVRGIMFSLDGPNEELNDRIRTGGFAKATAAMKKIAEMKRERQAFYPRLAVYATITNLTCDKIIDYVDLLHELGGPYGIDLEISMLIVESEGSAQYEMTPEQLAAFPDHVRKADVRAKELGLHVNFQHYLKPKSHCDGFGRLEESVYNPTGDIVDALCYEPWTAAAILPDGKLGPCCAFDADGNALSVQEKSFVEVWRGAYMNKVRDGMLNGTPPSYCDRCPSNLYESKEAIRSVCVKTINEKRAWENAGAIGRAATVLSRVGGAFKEHGPVKGCKRAIEKARVYTIARRAARDTKVTAD